MVMRKNKLSKNEEKVGDSLRPCLGFEYWRSACSTQLSSSGCRSQASLYEVMAVRKNAPALKGFTPLKEHQLRLLG